MSSPYDSAGSGLPPGVRHPWLDIKGPRAHVPPSGGPGELPYARTARRPTEPHATDWSGPRGPKVPLVALLAAVVVSVGITAAVVGRSPSTFPQETAAKAPTTTGSDRGRSAGGISTTTRSTRSTTPNDAETRVLDASDDRTPASTVPQVPVDELPRHEAVYRDGKLYLQGTVPSRAIADRFRAKAEAVIGQANVIERYTIDPRVPVPTDGRVRVDEQFLFPKDSSDIDPRYEPLMQLGVAVMKLNPHAQMNIVGYTDDSGSTDHNLLLSQRRADALRYYLAGHGVEPGRLVAIGRGETGFVAPNDTEADRARNRRIEVELIHLLAD